MRKEFVKSHLNLIILTCLACLLLLFSIVYLFWSNYQENITITPREIIEIYRTSGFSISNIQEIDDNNTGPLGWTKNGYSFELENDQKKYYICIIVSESWQKARIGTIEGNTQFENMKGNANLEYLFYFGSNVVVVYPTKDKSGDYTHKDLAKTLKKILNREYESIRTNSQ